jgi:hypothetical protein
MVVPPPPSKSKTKKIENKSACDHYVNLLIVVITMCFSKNKIMHLACYYTELKSGNFWLIPTIILTVCMFRNNQLAQRRETRSVTGTKQTPLRNHLPIFRSNSPISNPPETVAPPALHLHKVIVCTALFCSPRRG